MNFSILSSLMRTATQSSKSILSQRILKNCAGFRYTSYEPDGKTTVSILNSDPDSGLMIDSFSQMGFRLNNGLVVIGPMAIFPKTVLSWNITDVNEINEESLSLFCCLEPKLDILVLGVGDNSEYTKFDRNLMRFIHNNKINVEILATEQACATFNFLNAERRYVAAALVPPSSVRGNEDDIAKTKFRAKQFHKEVY